MQPFYSRAHEDYVVDERCRCGHLLSDHGSRTTKMDNGQMLRINHHGNCCNGNCRCPQFTWAGFVTAEEMADTLLILDLV
jgi:hypothetical protein